MTQGDSSTAKGTAMRDNGQVGNTLIPALPFTAEVSKTGLQLPEGLNREDWETCGQMLKQVEQAYQWWLGDWWAYGERKWGAGQELCERLGFNYNSITNWATVARSYEFSSRLENLTYSHHQEAAPLEEPARSSLLEWAAKTGASKAELRKEIKRLLKEENPPLPDDKYRVIYTLQRLVNYRYLSMGKN